MAVKMPAGKAPVAESHLRREIALWTAVALVLVAVVAIGYAFSRRRVTAAQRPHATAPISEVAA